MGVPDITDISVYDQRSSIDLTPFHIINIAPLFTYMFLLFQLYF